MTTEDFEQLQRVGRHLQILERVALISPVRKWRRRRPWKRTAISERAVFPHATELPRRRWDLNDPTDERFDLLVASNVFMYSHDPERWFANVLDACAYFLLVDLVCRKRSDDSEFGRDGDCLRFAVGRVRPRVSSYFELDTLGSRMLGAHTYPGGANVFDWSPVHVIALIRGEAALPTDNMVDVAAAVQSAQRELRAN